MTNKKYVAAIDQGTTSTRCIIFDHNGEQAAVGQLEHEQIFPEKGWVEHDPEEIWSNTRRAVGEALANGDITVEDIDSVGITNQRETTVVWDKATGQPIHHAVVWQDTRTQGIVDELAMQLHRPKPRGIDRALIVSWAITNAMWLEVARAPLVRALFAEPNPAVIKALLAAEVGIEVVARVTRGDQVLRAAQAAGLMASLIDSPGGRAASRPARRIK